MDILKAKEIVRSLADGVDPRTGELLPKESVYNSPEIIRALYTVIGDPELEKRYDLRNAGKIWSEIEDEKLKDEFVSKVKLSAIAREHGRTVYAIDVDWNTLV